MNDQLHTRLSVSEAQRIEELAEIEISKLPALDDTLATSWRTQMLGAISAFGAVVTLAIVEFIRSFGVWFLLIGFAWLEFERVKHGGLALKMPEQSATVLALVFVISNIVHPIYTLAHAHNADLIVTRHTVRGGFEWFFNRLVGKSETRKVDSTFNPTLAVSAFLLTMTTIILALYDVLSPLMTTIATGQADKPVIILITEFIMGAGMSIAGVLFLSASAHEAGLRAMSFDTRTPAEIKAEQKAQRQAEIEAIRERVRHDFIMGKLADEARKKADKAKATNEAVVPIETETPTYTNGNGKGNHADFLAVSASDNAL